MQYIARYLLHAAEASFVIGSEKKNLHNFSVWNISWGRNDTRYTALLWNLKPVQVQVNWLKLLAHRKRHNNTTNPYAIVGFVRNLVISSNSCYRDKTSFLTTTTELSNVTGKYNKRFLFNRINYYSPALTFSRQIGWILEERTPRHCHFLDPLFKGCEKGARRSNMVWYSALDGVDNTVQFHKTACQSFFSLFWGWQVMCPLKNWILNWLKKTNKVCVCSLDF